MEDLSPLVSLKQLTTLTMVGNPVVSMPNFKHQLFHHMPSLTTIDDTTTILSYEVKPSEVVAKEAIAQRSIFGIAQLD
jgi:hypothetical protein